MALPVAVFALVARFVGEDAPVGRNLLNAARGVRTPAILWVTAQNVLRSLGGTRWLTEPPCQARCRVWDGDGSPPPLASRIIANHLLWWYLTLYLPAAAMRVLWHPSVEKLASTDADLELGLTTWVIACRLPDGAGGLQPVLVIKLVVLDDLPRTVVVVSTRKT
eukprot:s2297_g8.t1